MSVWDIKQNIFFHKFKTEVYKEIKLKEVILGVRSELNNNYILDILKSCKGSDPIIVSKVESYRLSRNNAERSHGSGEVTYFEFNSLDKKGRIEKIREDITILDARKLQLEKEMKSIESENEL